MKASSPAALDWASAPQILPWAIEYGRATRYDTVERNTWLLHELGRDALRSYELLLGSELPPTKRRGYLILHFSEREAQAAIRLNAIRTSFGAAVRMVSEADIVQMEPVVRGVTKAATFVEKAGGIRAQAR
ncbi:glycine/D-amino acid oxidase-like deaminating enzyme [Bradyrhizobium sp. CIR18]|uniref:FAD-dependent oxidoreductase n=1 Tax=Bradyrhizobium sp. CIR18 TaxID=2663839 RepID=UPI001606A298|nr:FAD-dependent oxidoreductase [Bradyrhizobium sp. CIR18]MBB4365248.1 glycine/D-amino acid oxidase-like deaminating enzyme [Bradyrhizobium sp. CIR18]